MFMTLIKLFLNRMHGIMWGDCFTGGMNNRDWKLIKDLANKMPKVKFICAAIKNDFESMVSEIPDNMEVKYQILSDEYYRLMARAKVILLPLKYNTVSGLINIIKAAEYGAICLCTDYEFTNKYYCNKDFLMDNLDLDKWIRKVDELFYADEITYMNLSARFQKYIKENFSSELKYKELTKIIEEI